MKTLTKDQFNSRLEQLKSLQDGWLDGECKAPSHELIDLLCTKLGNNPYPFLYPTEDGGIQAEWSLNDAELYLNLSESSKKASFSCLSNDNAYSEYDYDIDDPSFWNFVSFVIERRR